MKNFRFTIISSKLNHIRGEYFRYFDGFSPTHCSERDARLSIEDSRYDQLTMQDLARFAVAQFVALT